MKPLIELVLRDSMVWVIDFPDAKNEFNPAADDSSWEKALEEYFYTEGQRPYDSNGERYEIFANYFSDVLAKFTQEIGHPRPHDPPLLPITPHEWPEHYVYKKTYICRAAMVEFPGRMLCVEEGLREVIERVEPRVHLFNPVRIILPKKILHPIAHHMMIVTRYLDSYRYEESDAGAVKLYGSKGGPITHYVEKIKGKPAYSGVAMSLSAIGDAHLWQEKEFSSGRLFMSDHLKAEIDKAGLRLPPHFQMKSVA